MQRKCKTRQKEMDGKLFTTEILSDILESITLLQMHTNFNMRNKLSMQITAQNISKTNSSYNYNTNHKLSLIFNLLKTDLIRAHMHKNLCPSTLSLSLSEKEHTHTKIHVQVH